MVAIRELAVLVTEGPNSTTVGEPFNLTVALSDAFTRRAISDISWRVSQVTSAGGCMSGDIGWRVSQVT